MKFFSTSRTIEIISLKKTRADQMNLLMNDNPDDRGC